MRMHRNLHKYGMILTQKAFFCVCGGGGGEGGETVGCGFTFTGSPTNHICIKNHNGHKDSTHR